MKILRYPLRPTGLQTIEMPTDASILTVQLQGDTPCLWAYCDDEKAHTVARKIRIFSTDESIPDDEGFLIYLGTIVVPVVGGLHVYEVDES